jgi:uncharacterized protein (DUF1499 family)
MLSSSNVAVSSTALDARLAGAALAGAIACAIVAIGSGLGYRLGLWEYQTGFTILRYAFFAAFFAGGASVIALATSRRLAPPLLMALTGLSVAALTAYVPWTYHTAMQSSSPLYDISTDVAHAPEFVALRQFRKASEHALTYEREDASLQREAYPDAHPLRVGQPREQVFDAARRALLAMGLEIVSAEAADGRIEAVATSLFYGFKDDVVVRLMSDSGGTLVDMRSQSRVGRGDMGVNANRIRMFMGRLQANLAQ